MLSKFHIERSLGSKSRCVRDKIPYIDLGPSHFLEGYIYTPLRNKSFHEVSARSPCVYCEKSRYGKVSRVPASDYGATTQKEISGMSNADLAKREAQEGFASTTASHLSLDNTLSISQKGEILAEAYTQTAERKLHMAESSPTPSLKEAYLSESKRSEKIAQGLTRAAKKSRDL